MRALLLFSVLMLTACATAPEPRTSERKLEMPQMAAGTCAVFGWSTDERRSFLFYADVDEAKYAPDGTVIPLIATDPFPSLNYTAPDGGPVSLKLGQGESMVGGTRFPYARILTKTAEGWDRFMPVAIVRSCQTP